MQVILIVLGYFKWHYSKAIVSLTKIWKNFLYFLFEFFSIQLLFKNFFDPWKRMTDNYPKSFNLKKYFYAFLANIIIRLVGMLMRLALIIIGLVACLLLIIAYPVAVAIWLLLPLIVIYLLSTGLFLIIK